MGEETQGAQIGAAEGQGQVPTKLMNFSEALALLKEGNSLARGGWNGKGQYIALQKPDANSANTLPYLYIITVSGDRVPWLASQTDLLAEDWMVVV